MLVPCRILLEHTHNLGESNKEEDTIAQFYEISADVDEEYYTSCEGSREER